MSTPNTAELERLLELARGRLRATRSDKAHPEMLAKRREALVEAVEAAQERLRQFDERVSQLDTVEREQLRRILEIKNQIRDLKHGAKIAKLQEARRQAAVLRREMIAAGMTEEQVDALIAEAAS